GALLLRRDEGNGRVLRRSLAVVECLLENRCPNPPVDGDRSSARVPTVLASRSRARMLLESGSTSVERLCWRRLMREAEERTKNEGQRSGKTRREKKKKKWRVGVPPNLQQTAKRGGKTT